MRVLPILFNTDMVRALLDGRKTVTRRLVKPQPTGTHTVLDSDEEARTFDLLCGNGGEGGTFIDWAETVKAPYWPGDILYVRETWCLNNFGWHYRADWPGAVAGQSPQGGEGYGEPDLYAESEEG